MKLTLVTGNPNKAREIQQMFPELKIDAHSFESPEIQSWSLPDIVAHKAQQAQRGLKTAVLVEDISLEFSALNNFPGPFVKFWSEVGGYDRAVEITQKLEDQKVIARCGVGYTDGRQLLYAEGVIGGTWVARRGQQGFGFDFYFLPEGGQETFSEMGTERKNQISHRFRGWRAMRQLLVNKGILL